MVVIPNQNHSIYTRLWCTYEAHTAFDIMNKDKKKEKDLQIYLPWVADKQKYALDVLPAVPVVLVAFALGWLLAPRIGIILGPVMWLVVTFLFCVIGSKL